MSAVRYSINSGSSLLFFSAFTFAYKRQCKVPSIATFTSLVLKSTAQKSLKGWVSTFTGWPLLPAARVFGLAPPFRSSPSEPTALVVFFPDRRCWEGKRLLAGHHSAGPFSASFLFHLSVYLWSASPLWPALPPCPHSPSWPHSPFLSYPSPALPRPSTDHCSPCTLLGKNRCVYVHLTWSSPCRHLAYTWLSTQLGKSVFAKPRDFLLKRSEWGTNNT